MAETDDTASHGRAERLRSGIVTVLQAIPGPLSYTADLLALGALATWAYRLFDGPGEQVVTAAFVCVAAASAVVVAGYLQHKLHTQTLRSRRAQRLARAQPQLVKLAGHLSRATAHMAAEGRENVQTQGDEAMRSLAALFTAITGTPCRASVKQMYVPEGSDAPAVKDVFRSHYPEHGRPPNGIDWVNQNSDFEDLLADGVTFWLANDLKAEYASGYKNSHITREQVRNDDLPYRSSLVVRIAGPGGGAPVHLAGFLCLDSPSTGTFRRDFDVSTAKYAAHGMYSILRWFQALDQKPAQPDTGSRS